MKILALDLGKFKTMCCIFDSKTREHEFLTATTDRCYLTTVFKKYQVDLVVMEACGPSGWINGLAAVTAQLELVIKKLEELGKHDPRIQRIKSIPGVGPRTAEILVACIDDPHRFENGRQVSAYFGLVPRQYQSGETDRNGRITKRGNPLARTILVECAWASLRYNSWAKAIYERVSGKQKTRRKKAAVALARKIAVIAWALLRDDRDWDPQRMIEVTESFGRMPESLKVSLADMKPKENSDQRKSRLRREARAAKESAAARVTNKKENKSTPPQKKSMKKSEPQLQVKSTLIAKQQSKKSAAGAQQKSKAATYEQLKASSAKEPSASKSRRARKPVSRSGGHA